MDLFTYLFIFLAVFSLVTLILILVFLPKGKKEQQKLRMMVEDLEKELNRLEMNLKDDFRINREEFGNLTTGNRKELSEGLRVFGSGLSQNLKEYSESNTSQLDRINATTRQKLQELTEQARADNTQMRESVEKVFRNFQESFEKNVASFNDLQREKFGQLEEKQNKLVESTEKKLEQMRETVEEKLQKTLNERLGQSFELVGKQLESVQKGLGEMQTLAQDVGGLKKVLSNVKLRGGIGEVQLGMLLEQVLAPEQYEANVCTKKGSSDSVEYAIKLPGREDNRETIYLPIDAKFPKDKYEKMLDAYEQADPSQIEIANKELERTIKMMAADIHNKYIDPPNTTDFAIMFLPFEGIYAEVVRRTSLLEHLQREFKVIVTGPTTLAAILNSLQMGFRTLAIQQRSSEVWRILGAVKKEFENFGGMLEKAQRNIQTASNQIDEVMGKRTRAIQRKLRSVETLSSAEASLILPETGSLDDADDQEEDNNA
ncbi:MAG: DNA recombination protein RmuC [Bacteroidales bacterium]|jgi:DNA recombination protein RmuC|nr:DNA recombination protein RmuC [Bacteroidales bacterium]